VPLANRKSEGCDPAASATSMRKVSLSWLPLSTTDIRVLVESPDLGGKEQAMVVGGGEW
jgi:hypothetical protein